jgi:hypothetical protein
MNAVDLTARFSHRWADRDLRFQHLSYGGRRAIEQALNHAGYFYWIVGRRTDNPIPEIQAYHAVCREFQIPFIVILARNAWSTVICDLSTSRTILDPTPSIYNAFLIRLAQQARSESWVCGDDPNHASWFCAEDVWCMNDRALASSLAELSKRYGVPDESWQRATDLQVSTFGRWKQRSGPGWFRTSTTNWVRLWNLKEFTWAKDEKDPDWLYPDVLSAVG